MGIHTANEVHLPVGRPVRFLLESADVIHSFWIPAMGGKRDVVPGHTNELTFTPEVTGDYIGECAEFCGLSHANMRFRVFVQSPVAFDDWRANQSAGPLHSKAAAMPRDGRAGLYDQPLHHLPHHLGLLLGLHRSQPDPFRQPHHPGRRDLRQYA